MFFNFDSFDNQMVKKAKIIFIGDSAVGKSCLITALNGHPVSQSHEPTIGMDFSIKMCQGSTNTYKLQLWDTAGQQKFRSVMPSFIRNSKIAVLVYDVTCVKSFSNLDKWFEFFEQSAGQGTKLIVVGNKIDSYNDRKVELKKIQLKIERKGLNYRQLSARSGEGTHELLEQIIAQLDRMEIKSQTGSQDIKLNSKSPKKIGKCCGSK